MPILALTLLGATFAGAADNRALTVERLTSQPSITGTAPTAVAWSADNRYLAFSWNDSGLPRRHVWMADADGSKLHRLTAEQEPAVSETEFAWTADAPAIVFLRADVRSNFHVRTAVGPVGNASGAERLTVAAGGRVGLPLDQQRAGVGKPKLLTSDKFDGTAGPYVASRALYYQSSERNPYEKQVFRLADGGGKATRITAMAGENQPFPSPDGTKVAFLHTDYLNPSDLYLTHARGGAP